MHHILQRASGRVNRFGPRESAGAVSLDDPVTGTPGEIFINAADDTTDIKLVPAISVATAASGLWGL